MWVVTIQHWCSAFTLGIYQTEGEARARADRYPTRNGEWVQIERREHAAH
jgi:hypothetical protein